VKPRLLDGRVQRWLQRRRWLSGTAVLGGGRSGANVRVQPRPLSGVGCNARVGVTLALKQKERHLGTLKMAMRLLPMLMV